MNGQTRQREGKVTASPRAKVKAKARARPGKGNHNQDQGGPPNEDGQRTLCDFGTNRQRDEIVGDVQENDDFETPTLDRAAYVFCVQKCKSVVQKCNSISMDSTELPSSSTRVFDGSEEPASQRERCLSPLDVEMIDQLLTLEVLCLRAQWIMRRQFRQRQSITV